MTSLIETDTYFTSLPQSFYNDPSVYAVDIEKVWKKQWLLAGHISQLPRAGDYFTFELANESLIVIRGKDEAIHALYNVCRHRGYRLCEAGSTGTAKRLVCRYHAWTYGQDGSLISARADVDGGPFNYSDFGLHQAQVEIWQGFVWVNFSDEPLPPLVDSIRDANESFARLETDRLKIAHTITYRVTANWKIFVENTLECYHCAPSHPELCNTLDLAAMHEHHHGWNADRPYAYSWMPLHDGALSLTMDGQPVSQRWLGEFGRSETPEEGFATGLQFQPTDTFAMFYLDHGVTGRIFPVSPSETLFRCDWYVHEDAVEGVDYAIESLIALWDVTNRQDIALAEGTQLGVNSSKYTPGPNSAQFEPGVRSMLGLYLRMTGADHTVDVPSR